MKKHDGVLEGLIFIMLLLPIGAYFIIKWLIFGIVFLIKTLCDLFKSSGKKDSSAPINTDNLAFAQYVAFFLRSNGFSDVVASNKGTKTGAVITAENGARMWVFVCTACRGRTGRRAVKKAFDCKNLQHADTAVAVTNKAFTWCAQKLAAKLGVSLWGQETISKKAKNLPFKDTAARPPRESTAEPFKEAPPNPSQKSTDDLHRKTEIGFPNKAATNLSHRSPENLSEGMTMAAIIGAGKYIFGGNIPPGQYDLRVVSGSGMLKIQVDDDDEDWINLGLRDDFAKTYAGLSLPTGHYFTLDGSVQVEIKKAATIEIE